MSDNQKFGRRIDRRREELARSSEQFLAQGGQVVEVVRIEPATPPPPPAVQAKWSLFRSTGKNAAPRREAFERQVVALPERLPLVGRG